MVENSHEAIIDKPTFQRVRAEVRRRREAKKPVAETIPNQYPFTSLIVCGKCGKHYRRKITAAGTKYAKAVWICATFNTQGKVACPSQQIPEAILLEKTRAVLRDSLPEKVQAKVDWESLSNLRDYIAQILVPRHNQLVYILNDGREVPTRWENPSRKASWTPEMREQARRRQLSQEERKRKE